MREDSHSHPHMCIPISFPHTYISSCNLAHKYMGPSTMIPLENVGTVSPKGLSCGALGGNVMWKFGEP